MLCGCSNTLLKTSFENYHALKTLALDMMQNQCEIVLSGQYKLALQFSLSAVCTQSHILGRIKIR